MSILGILPIGDINTTSSTRLYDLGEKREIYSSTYGMQTFRYIQNTSGGAIGPYLGVMQEDGTSLWNGKLSGANVETARFLGVRQSGSLADTYYGWILCKGYGLCTSDGSTTANTAQQGAASGQFTDGVVGTDELPVFANETEAPAGAGGFFKAMINAL